MSKMSSNNKSKRLLAIFFMLGFTLSFFIGYQIMSEKSPPINIRENNEDSQSSDLPDNASDSININYAITGINKEKGDIFSVPDNITYTISPEVEKSRVTLLYFNERILFKKDIAASTGDVTIFPDGKLQENSKGTLLIEGFVNDEIVVSEKIEVIF